MQPQLETPTATEPTAERDTAPVTRPATEPSEIKAAAIKPKQATTAADSPASAPTPTAKPPRTSASATAAKTAAPAPAAPAPAPTAPAPAAPAPALESIEKVCDAMRSATSERVAWKQAAKWFGSVFKARHLLLELDGRTGSSTITIPEANDPTWQRICDALVLKSRQLAEIVTQSSGNNMYAVAVPMRRGESMAVGAVALALSAESDSAAQATARELMAYVRVCEEAIRNRVAGSGSSQAASEGASVRQGVTQAGSYESLHEYAFAITNGLKVKFGCDEVAISILHDDNARILSISGMDALHPRSPGSKLMQHAMEEAADAEAIVVAPTNHGESALVNLPMHEQWLADSGSSAVASFPLKHNGEIAGVVSLRRTDGTVFSDEELLAAKKLVAPLAAGLVLLDQANRSLMTHARHTMGSLTGRWSSLQKSTRRGVMLAGIAFVGWMLLGSTTYTLQVPCEIVAAEPLDIAVPFESRLAKAYVRPGDFVRAGQPLVEFDTSALMAEHQRLKAELKIAEIATIESLTMQDIASAGQARNQADAARASIAIINEQIGQSIVAAPFDGYVLAGDVLRRVGEVLPVGTELLQLGAADKLAVEMRVDEGGSTYIASGMTGEFSTLARPGDHWKCAVSQVDASASAVDGENIFKARAEPEETIADWLRPGMQGIARIETGSQPVWWVYLHGVTDWVRLQAWKL